MKSFKINLFVLFCGLMIFATCKSNKEQNLSGVYVNDGRSEFSVASDTLIISELNSESMTFLIERHTGFNSIKNGRMLPRQYEQSKWVGNWDANHQVLTEGQYGRQIRISPDHQGILLRTTPYQKVKN
ncbi:hypothetical protein MTO98_30555 [Mucilaginibacter sp. SMC90]|uniref:Uncharacterized protein n=1 Tax=Mucilaginibacter rubeus TaxID=2027860 RepID=A0A5C1I357_9SPHI|nr:MULTISPECIES: hypothetical protein [Mucilaginibacter]QEM12423.1 hypothetical protein DEO27_021175 [Mucilaginibacter rubeus]UOE48743.1 hypothetical protein MTO98_30555 [Mucilaginibacter sp. SMC90]